MSRCEPRPRGARGDRRSRARLAARRRRHDLRAASQSLPRLQRGVQPVPALPSRRRSQVHRLEAVRAHRPPLHEAVPRDDEPGLPDRARRQRVDGLSRGAAAASRSSSTRGCCAASLAHLVSRQGDAVGLVTYADALAAVPAEPRRAGAPAIACCSTLSRTEPGGQTDGAAALGRTIDLLKRRGLLIVISDLYDERAGRRAGAHARVAHRPRGHRVSRADARRSRAAVP